MTVASIANKSVSGTEWTLLFTAASPTLVAVIQSFAPQPLMLHIGASDPGAGDASQSGRMRVKKSDGGHPSMAAVTLADADKLWGRLTSGLGSVSVLSTTTTIQDLSSDFDGGVP